MKKFILTTFIILLLTICGTNSASASNFTDIEHWSKNYIEYSVEKNYFFGLNTTTFAPDQPMTRGMLVTVLYRYCNETTTFSNIPFVDVAEGDYFYEAVVWAYQNKIIKGTSETTFSPNENVSREDAAVILYNLYKGNGNKNYSDYSLVSDYAKEAVKNCELFQGNNLNQFMPSKTLTRAEMCVIFANKDGEKLNNYEVPKAEVLNYSYGKASAYSYSLIGGLTASGERLSSTSYTVAVPISQYKTYAGRHVEITYNGITIVAKCNDCGGFEKYGRVLDLSPGCIKAFGFSSANSWGVKNVQYRWIN